MTDMIPGIVITSDNEEKNIVVRSDARDGNLLFVILWLLAEFVLLSHMRVQTPHFSLETIIYFLSVIVWQIVGILPATLICVWVFGRTITLTLRENKITRTERIGRLITQKLETYDVEKISNPRVEETQHSGKTRDRIVYDIVFDYSGQKRDLHLFVSKEKTEAFFLEFRNLLNVSQNS
jgi:hypothetical protein